MFNFQEKKKNQYVKKQKTCPYLRGEKVNKNQCKQIQTFESAEKDFKPNSYIYASNVQGSQFKELRGCLITYV